MKYGKASHILICWFIICVQQNPKYVLDQAKIWEFKTSCFSSHLIGPWTVVCIIALDRLSKNACHAKTIWVQLACSRVMVAVLIETLMNDMIDGSAWGYKANTIPPSYRDHSCGSISKSSGPQYCTLPIWCFWPQQPHHVWSTLT